MIYINTSARIKKALEERDMTQADLAKQSGIAKSSISVYVSGQSIPRQFNLIKIARVLNVNELWLMGIESNMNPNSSDIYDVKIESLLRNLNSLGKERVISFIEDILEISKYINEDE